METRSAAEAPAARRPSAVLSAAIGLAVVAVVLLFAFESAWYDHWYAVFRVVHVLVSVLWVGGGLLLVTLGLAAERKDDAVELATLARQAAWVGDRVFAPAGLVVFLMGIAMMVRTDWGWGRFWVVAGLVGNVLTFGIGVTVLGPLAKRITRLVEMAGPAAPETQAAIKRALLVARLDTAVLLLVAADMVTKPFS